MSAARSSTKIKTRTVLITCGPTREPLDPVRFISNRSTGTLGFELARAFSKKGHRVILAAGPIEVPADLDKKPNVRVIRFETALDLQKIAIKASKRSDVILMTAAVADFRPAAVSSAKIKRGKSALTVKLIPNPDILAKLGRRKRPGQVLVGFAVESSAPEARAKQKLLKKNLDLIAVQRVGKHNPFGPNPMNTTLIGRHGVIARHQAVSKAALAQKILQLTTQIA